jgi:hypothetical protein
MVAPMVGSMMLVGGSRIGELDAAFDELSRSVGFGGSPPNKLCFAPASFLDQSRAYSFGASWGTAPGAAERTEESGAPLSLQYPEFSLAAAGGWIEPAGIGMASGDFRTSVTYKSPLAASTVYSTSMYGMYTLTDEGGDVSDYGTSSSASHSDRYYACSPSGSDGVIVSAQPVEYVPSDEYTNLSDIDSFVGSSPTGQHEMACAVAYSSPGHDHDVATNGEWSSPGHEAPPSEPYSPPYFTR